MPRYTEAKAREAVAAAHSYSEALRALGMRPAGGNHKLFRHWVDEVWRIPTDHFDPHWASRGRTGKSATPLEDVLVENSSYQRAALKRRLLSAGLLVARCELCGQDDRWRGRRLSLILDHINGIPDDNRLENLRMVCPNCAATLDTHCGRKNAIPEAMRICARCGDAFVPAREAHRYCSRRCSVHAPKIGQRGVAKSRLRRVERPPRDQLLAELEATSYVAVGRKYGVSDNAVRKWVRFYEREAARQDGPGEGAEAA